MDDVFGGAHEKNHAQCLKDQLIGTELMTFAIPNLKKCQGPSQKSTLLGMMSDTINKKVTLPETRQLKLSTKLHDALSHDYISSKTLEKIVGYLVYASYAEPFGRPFISAISSNISRRNPYRRIRVEEELKTALLIWISILTRNIGISFNYSLNKLERSLDE